MAGAVRAVVGAARGKEVLMIDATLEVAGA